MYRQVPPKVEYTLSGLGRGSMPLVEALTSWGGQYAAHQRRELAREADDAESPDDLPTSDAGPAPRSV